jgi:steroid 5-alpha reductase family enzyme
VTNTYVGLDQFHAFVDNLLPAALTVLAWVTLAFLVSRVVKRHAVIDVFWGAGFLVVFAESLLNYWGHDEMAVDQTKGMPAKLVVGALVALWSLRLSIYLAIRQRGQGEDSRYVFILRGKTSLAYAYAKIYLVQAVLMYFISLPLQFIASAHHFNHLVLAVGSVMVLVGLAFEATGDAQLRRFLKNPANEGRTMSTGIWAWTRHPNYFGDTVVWWGFFTLALSAKWGFVFVLSPLAMNFLLTRVSGKPLLEHKLKKTREGYAEYLEATSPFIPRPPRKR